MSQHQSQESSTDATYAARLELSENQPIVLTSQEVLRPLGDNRVGGTNLPEG